MDASLQRYRRLVEALARGRVDERFSNGLPAHARIVLETIFKHAEHTVRLYTGDLDSKVYDNQPLISAARQFLCKPGSALRVLLQNHAAEATLKEREFFRVLGDRPPEGGSLEVGLAGGVYATKNAKHFCVMDDRGYRFEHDHDRMQAVANFNEPEIAGKLVDVFDRVMSESKRVAI